MGLRWARGCPRRWRRRRRIATRPALHDSDDDLAEPIISRDVEVARRLYRSGESEYLIDGRVCRLRDIQDLLMDSGLGVKAYAVIEQGRIGQILGARPAERRQLLEEAAGVTKYRTRRRTAELKLEAAQQNLTRVDDIVFEVEKQRGALKRQAAKARRYRRLREELRRWQRVHFARRSRLLENAIETATRRLEEAREGERGAAAALAALENDRERRRLELAETDGAATALRETAHAREIEVERHQQQNRVREASRGGACNRPGAGGGYAGFPQRALRPAGGRAGGAEKGARSMRRRS